MAESFHSGHFSERVMAIMPLPVPRSNTFIFLLVSNVLSAMSINSSVSGLGIRVAGETIKSRS